MMFAYIRNDIVHTVSVVSDMQWRDGDVVECPEHIDYGWRYKNGEWLEPSPPAPKPQSRILTRLEYMNQFTDAELAAIYTAAKSVVEIEIWLEKFKVTTEVDIDDPRTVSGVQALEGAGLIAAGRAQEILAATVSGGL